MAKLTRKTQKIFSQTSSENGQFGSGLVGTKVLSDDPDVLQALSAWLGGWTDATLGGQKLPPLEEMNGVQYVQTRQLAYLFEQGIPEYDAGTTYYQKSIVCKTGTYELYGSVTDNNTGNALTDNTNWEFITSFKGNTIIDYTEVKTVGEVDQILAGRDYTLTELENYFGAANVYSFYKFNSSDISKDETMTYPYARYAGAYPVNSDGIMGSNNAIYYDGTNQYMTNFPKLNNMDTTFTNGFVHSFWVRRDTLPGGGGASIFYKRNLTGTNSIYDVAQVTSITANFTENDGTPLGFAAVSGFFNSTLTGRWAHVVIAFDVDQGLRIYVDGFLGGEDTTMTSLPTGSGLDFIMGDGDGFFNGYVSNEIILNAKITEQDVNFLYGSKFDIPTNLQGLDFTVDGFCKIEGVTKTNFNPEVVALQDDIIVIKGDSFQKSTNEIKLIGRL